MKSKKSRKNKKKKNLSARFIMNCENTDKDDKVINFILKHRFKVLVFNIIIFAMYFILKYTGICESELLRAGGLCMVSIVVVFYTDKLAEFDSKYSRFRK